MHPPKIRLLIPPRQQSLGRRRSPMSIRSVSRRAVAKGYAFSSPACNNLTPLKDKLSEEALTERMARMREQNEKIKQRRLVRLLICLPLSALKLFDCRMCKLMKRPSAKRKSRNAPSLPRSARCRRPSIEQGNKTQRERWIKFKAENGILGNPPATGSRSQSTSETAASQVVDDDKKEDGPAPAEVSSPPRDSGGWTRGSPRGGPQRARGRGRGRGGTTSSPTPQRDASSPTAEASSSTPSNPESVETLKEAAS
ncbi:hypothetical protein FPV67DRAFT_41390 [Lyophyllum atratum]|nr:hypothetical protein FPV67DRAFT_41390 [Lyophyllum atratum]